jgi:hypothetical protein
MNDLAAVDLPLTASPADVLRGVLIDSRQRWRELVNLADFAFETDEWGRFTLISPDPALGWAPGSLIGQSAATLLVEGGGAVFDPFRVTAKVRHRQAWLKRGDGGSICLGFSAAPIHDPSGRIIGARGVGTDMTELDGQAAQAAAALRRSEVMDHVLGRITREVTTSRMMGSALDVVTHVLGAEGVAVLFGATGSVGASLAYVAGTGAEAIVEVASRQLQTGDNDRGWAPGTRRGLPHPVR